LVGETRIELSGVGGTDAMHAPFTPLDVRRAVGLTCAARADAVRELSRQVWATSPALLEKVSMPYSR